MALAAGALLVLAACLRGWVNLRKVAGEGSWEILALVVGLFLVVQGVENAGFGALAERAFVTEAPGDGFLQILGIVFGSALGSNVIKNVPMTVLSLGAIEPLIEGGTLDLAAVYAIVVGPNIGPNLNTVGSLATLTWLSIARGKGLDISAKEYLKVGAIITPPILLAAAVGLWASVRLFGVG